MKKLIAIAIATAVSAPALADTTLYGQFHASYDVLSGASDISTVSSNISRIGVKGSADLTGGLKAIYQAEWGMDLGGAGGNLTGNALGTRSSVLSNRNQVVGLAGGFGAVLIGRHDTPLKIVGRKADLFWSSQLGQNRSILNSRSYDLRANNVLAYQSPKMGGFQALAAYITDIAGTDDVTGFSINGMYSAGPLTLGAGYETHNVDDPTATTLGAGDQDAIRLMASYKFGDAKVVGFYQDENNDAVLGGVALGGASVDASVWGLGASYKVSSAGTVKGQYYERDNATGLDATLLSVGYDHKLGKKTHVYAQYAAAEDTALGGNGHGESVSPDAGGDATGFSLGIRHKF